jgi:NADH:ubiquinone oxidoreductase subunit E
MVFKKNAICSDKATKISKVLFQSVEYIHRRTQMITARVAAVITFYRMANSAL